jgi:hypothetical protein
LVWQSQLVRINICRQQLRNALGAASSWVRDAPNIAEGCVFVGGLGADQAIFNAVDEVNGPPGRDIIAVGAATMLAMFSIARFQPFSNARNGRLFGRGRCRCAALHGRRSFPAGLVESAEQPACDAHAFTLRWVVVAVLISILFAATGSVTVTVTVAITVAIPHSRCGE